MNQSGKAASDRDALAFLGSGEMGERTQTFDWSQTPLGPAADWPQSLKTVVRIMLDSRYAMWLGWGPHLTFFYNDAYAQMTLGAKHPWALGRPAREVWSEIWDEIGPRAESVIHTGKATWDESLLLFVQRRGFPEESYHTFSYSPVPDDGGGIGGMLCVVTEDTQRTIGERRLRTLRELAARTPEGTTSVEDACRLAAQTLDDNPRDLAFVLLYLLDEEGRRARLGGSSRLERDTPASPAIVEIDDPNAPWPFRQVVETNRAIEVSNLSAKFDPLPGGVWPESPREAVVLPMAKPGQTRLAGFVVAGISPRLVFDDDYKGFLDLLAGHIATVIANTGAYEEERRRAEALAELDRAKTAFFSNVSHEFRTPLTLMLGPVEDMLLHSDTQLAPAAKEQLELVNRNGLRLLRLVNTLLDFSRIEAGRLRAVYRPTDLAAFTADLASVFRAACERAGLRLTVDCSSLSEPAYVDRELWEKIVLNLLSNAFKFTFAGEIAVGLRQVGQAVELRVQDTGTGIPAEEMPRLFERFHRVENARGRTHEGSGIGLALVQELVHLHGGSLRAESVVGRGTTFFVTIPLGKSHLPPEHIGESRTLAAARIGANPYVEEALRWLPEEEANRLRKLPGGETDKVEAWQDTSFTLSPDIPVSFPDVVRPRVLVADDNADMRRYLARLLADSYDIESVADGAAALTAAREHLPDLVLTDVMMPQLDGFGLLRELRADPRTQSIPVLMLSARAGEESRVEGMAAGADDYLVKPFSARELRARVSAHIQMARLRREANALQRQGEERLRMALTAARMVAWQLDPVSGKVVVSDNVAEVFGLPSGSTLENSEQGFALIHPDDVERHWATVMQATRECHSYLSRFRMIRPDNGSVIWLEERGHAVCDEENKIVQLVGVVMDITERKRFEEENARLVEDLREADRRKDEFLATLAHELRNPLAPIRNGLQILKLADGDGRLLEQARTMMERQLGQMVRLVDDLLDVSRITRNKLELRKERIELAAVVNSAIETSRPLIEASGHTLTVALPPQPIYLAADFTRLAQVFSNLLNNAAKYTERGGRIWLNAERRGEQVMVSVKDTGTGIPPAMLPKVFDLFTQVERTLDRAQGGLGIGLTLVQRLVEMHGGRVEAHSEGAGKGTQFNVFLPIAAEKSAGAANEESAGAPSRSSLRILIVDDNRDGADSLALMLTMLGNETHTAYDGEAGVEAAKQLRPHVILLDIGLPKLSGYEACRLIREQPWAKQAVLVAVTGWGQEEDIRRSQRAGFDHHLVKPVAPQALMTLLAGLS